MWCMILVVAYPCVFLCRTRWGTLSACSTTWWPTWETGWRICTETLWVYSCWYFISLLFVLLLYRAAVRRVVPKVCTIVCVCVCFRRACPRIRTRTRFTLRQSWLTQRLEMSLPKCFRRAHQRAVLPEGWVWHHTYLWRWIVISENKIPSLKHTHVFNKYGHLPLYVSWGFQLVQSSSENLSLMTSSKNYLHPLVCLHLLCQTTKWELQSKINLE